MLTGHRSMLVSATSERYYIGDFPNSPEDDSFYIRIFDLEINLLTCFEPSPYGGASYLMGNSTYVYNFYQSTVEVYPVDYGGAGG